MDLVYLMLNDKGQTEHVQLLNPSGVPQVLDANDPLVSRLNTGPGSGKPVQVRNDDGEIVEAMQLTEYHYFVDENNKVIPIPPGSIAQGEFEDEEDDVNQSDAHIGIHLPAEAVNVSLKETKMSFTENVQQHPETVSVTCNDQELEQLQASESVESNTSGLLGSDNSQHKKDLVLDKTSEFGQNVLETIFTQDEIELEEEVVSLQISEPVAVTHRPPSKSTKKAVSCTNDPATSTAKDAHKGADTIFSVDQQGKSPTKKSKRKQGSVVSGEEQSGDKALLQQGVKNANSVVELSSVQSDSSLSETGRPRRSVPRRSALEMLHGEGKTVSQKRATSSGSDSELDVGSNLPSSGKRRNSKVDRATKTATLSHSASELPPLTSNENTKLEITSDLNSSLCSSSTDAPPTFTSVKRGKGRPRKVTHTSLLPSDLMKSSDLIEDKTISLSYTVINEPNDVAQPLNSVASSSSSLPSVNDTSLVPVEQCSPISIYESPAAKDNLQKESTICAGEVLKMKESNLGEFCSDDLNPVQTAEKNTNDSSDEGSSCVVEFQSNVTGVADQTLVSAESVKNQMKESEKKIDVGSGSTSDQLLRGIHASNSKVEAGFEPSAVSCEKPKNGEEAGNLEICSGKDFTGEIMHEEHQGTTLCAGKDGVDCSMQDESQINTSLNLQFKSVSAVEDSGISFQNITAKDSIAAAMSLEGVSMDNSMKRDDVFATEDSDWPQEDMEEETDAAESCKKSASLQVSQWCRTERPEVGLDVECNSAYEVCSHDANKADGMESETTRDDEIANADFLELHGHDEEDIHSLERDTYPEQENACDYGDIDTEMENTRKQTSDKIEASGRSSVHLLLADLKNAQKKMMTVEEPFGLDSKTALLILAEIEQLASEIRSKLVQQEPGQDVQMSTATGQSWKTWKQANEKRLQRIVSNELMKLRALDEEVDKRYNQLIIARGQLSRKESQVKQQQLALERSQMLLDLDKEQFEEEQKKLRREKERKLHLKLKQGRKRLADNLAVQSSSNKKARISDTARPLLSVDKHRRPLFEEITAIKETKAITTSSKTWPLLKSSSVPISRSLSDSGPDTKLKEMKLCLKEVSDEKIAGKLDSLPKPSSKMEILESSSAASVVVKGKKELLRRFEADELNSPSEDLAPSKFIQKPMKHDVSSCSSGSISAFKKASKRCHGLKSPTASSKFSAERSVPSTYSRGESLVKRSSPSESKSCSKDVLSTARAKKHSLHSGSLMHKSKVAHQTDSRNLSSPSFDGLKKKESKTPKRSV